MSTSSTLSAIESAVGNEGCCRYPSGDLGRFKVEDEIRIVHSNCPDKYFSAQKIRYGDGIEEVTLGYYVIGKKERRKGQWVWRQYRLFFPVEDLARMFDEFDRRGWLKKSRTIRHRQRQDRNHLDVSRKSHLLVVYTGCRGIALLAACGRPDPNDPAEVRRRFIQTVNNAIEKSGPGLKKPVTKFIPFHDEPHTYSAMPQLN